MKPCFFKSGREFRNWLSENHSRFDELWVGYYKKTTGKQSMTWEESVEQAICYGWIDGLRKSIDDVSYTIRFTPRRKNSTWSVKNINTLKKLKEKGLMCPPGIQAFENRKVEKTRQYSYEQAKKDLRGAFLKKLKSNDKAWEFFREQAPYYKKTAVHWVMSAKRETTRQRRLDQLIRDSERQMRVKPLRRKKK